MEPVVRRLALSALCTVVQLAAIPFLLPQFVRAWTRPRPTDIPDWLRHELDALEAYQ